MSCVGKTASMSMLTLFESRYTLKGRYSIGNVGQTASMSMLTLFESIYTLKGMYSIGNVGKTASMSMLTLFESRYILKGSTILVMLAKLLLKVYFISLNQLNRSTWIGNGSVHTNGYKSVTF